MAGWALSNVLATLSFDGTVRFALGKYTLSRRTECAGPCRGIGRRSPSMYFIDSVAHEPDFEMRLASYLFRIMGKRCMRNKTMLKGHSAKMVKILTPIWMQNRGVLLSLIEKISGSPRVDRRTSSISPGCCPFVKKRASLTHLRDVKQPFTSGTLG